MRDKAIIIKIEGGYFSGRNESGHLMTAHKLPGAKLFFLTQCDEVAAIVREANRKGREADPLFISVIGG